jgi:hypothetical protein
MDNNQCLMALTPGAAVCPLGLPLFTSLSSADAVLPSCLLEQSTSLLQLESLLQNVAAPLRHMPLPFPTIAAIVLAVKV